MVCKYFILFIEFSILGWIWESIYCAFAHKKWCNRGFLFGPLCPIYGTACIMGVALLEYLEAHNIPMLDWWKIFLLSVVVSAVLEYIISYTLEELFHARWWDYSDVPLNINGRVSLPTACGFGLGGLLVMYVIAPFSIDVMNNMNPVLAEIGALALMAVLGSDLTLTINHLTDFLKELEQFDESFQSHMTELVDDMVERRSASSRGALRRVRSFSPSRRLRNRGLTHKHFADFNRILHDRLENR